MKPHPLVPLGVCAILALPAAAQEVPLSTSPPPPGVPAYLLREEKIRSYRKETLTAEALVGCALKGAMSQALDFSGQWGDGPEAYAARMGSNMARSVVKNSIRMGLDTAMGLDSRYRPSPESGFWNRLGHSLASTVLAHKDEGGRTLGVPALAGTYGSAFAANAWYPRTANSPQDALIRGTTSLGWTAGKNVFKEFWPDIRKALGR